MSRAMSFKPQSSSEGRALVRKLKGNLKDKRLVYDATCGLHSGFPACCVAFYILVWHPAIIELRNASASGLDTPTFSRRYASTIDAVAGRSCDQFGYASPGVGYVACPACLLARSFVKVKVCRCYDKPTTARSKK